MSGAAGKGMTPPSGPSRIYQGRVSDSSRWQAYVPRKGDVILTTPPKSGTTWLQAIVAMMFAGDTGVDAGVSQRCPWIDASRLPVDEVMAAIATQTGRRQVKSHTPLDGIPIWPDLRYIVVYRHPIDVHFSFRNHVANMNPDLFGDLVPPDLEQSFELFLGSDDIEISGLLAIVHHYRQTLLLRGRDNILCLHYADLCADLRAGLAQIASHIDIRLDAALLEQIADAATFSSMKSNAQRFVPAAGRGFWKSDTGFFQEGGSGKWKGLLSQTQLQLYERTMAAQLTGAERQWLEFGATGHGSETGRPRR